VRRAGLLLLLLLPTLAGAAEERMKKPDAAPGSVTLSLAEYDHLVDRAAQSPLPTEAPPQESVIASADVSLKVSGDHVRGTATLEGDVLRRGVTRVLIGSQVGITGAHTGTAAVPLLQDGGRHFALLSGPASFSLKLDLAMAVTTEAGRASFAVPALRAGTIRVRLEVPGPNADVKIDAGLVLHRTATATATVIEATIAPSQAVRISWTARDKPSASHEARWVSDVKTLVSIGEADLRLAVLADITLSQGQAERFDIDRPAGFDLADVSGQTLESVDDSAPGRIGVVVRPGSGSHHQFLILLERASTAVTFAPPLLSVSGSQRETGEVAVEGIGTLELTSQEKGTLRRLDVREISPALRSLAQQPLLAAFRYHRRASETPGLDLAVTRFPAAPVLAALAERAIVTTLVTRQGRMLTEVALTVRNQAQPFLKVGLPAGAQLLSAEVAGEKVKPVEGKDGTRVPLLRAGFQPNGPYEVSFVYVQSGAPFGKKGEAQLSLARVDLPVNLVTWELFLPDAYKVEQRGGNVVPEATVTVFTGAVENGIEGGVAGGVAGGVLGGVADKMLPAAPPPPPREVMEEIQIVSKDQKQVEPATNANAPSSNVLNLQRRVAGVLPIAVEVPRTGTSHRFVRPLVIDEETTLSFRYRAR
jgi:hypothetical protein